MRALLLLGVLCATAAFAGDPVIGVGDEASRAAQDQKPDQAAPEKPVPETRVIDKRTWSDAERVGKYDQPRWTTKRHFVGTRVYVAPPGAVTFESWLDLKVPANGGDARFRTLYELSIGLGARFQVDLYLRTENLGTQPLRLESERIEVRWALANWGVIPGNPALYLEWVRNTEGPQALEVKLLFGGEFSDRLYWGLNLFFERQLWGTDQTHEYGGTAGLSYALVDKKLSLGAELNIEAVDYRNERFQARELEFLIGPSMSFQPIEGAHLLLVLYGGPGFEREAATDPFGATFVFQPTLVGGWRF